MIPSCRYAILVTRTHQVPPPVESGCRGQAPQNRILTVLRCIIVPNLEIITSIGADLLVVTRAGELKMG